jgi:hypothetical protein
LLLITLSIVLASFISFRSDFLVIVVRLIFFRIDCVVIYFMITVLYSKKLIFRSPIENPSFIFSLWPLFILLLNFIIKLYSYVSPYF